MLNATKHCAVCNINIKHFDPFKACTCTEEGKRKAFETELRETYASAEVGDADASEILLLLGTVLGRAQASVLNGDRVSLRRNLVELTALSWKLGDDL